MDSETKKQIFIQEYLNGLYNYHATLPWFLLSNNIGIHLISKYLDEFEDNATSGRILSLYIICKGLLENPSSTSNKFHMEYFLSIIPEEIWGKRIRAEIDALNSNKITKFDLLIDYKRCLYHRFKACELFRKFEELVITKSKHLAKILSKNYNIYRYQDKRTRSNPSHSNRCTNSN